MRKFNYGQGPIPFASRDWKRFEEEERELMQDLIQKCLNMDPEERISAAEALDHEWFKFGKTEKVVPEIENSLKE